MLTPLQYNLYLVLVNPITFILGFNFSHEPSKPTCLPINISPSTLEGGSRMCGSVSIVLAKVLPNFLQKFFNPLVSTLHGIHDNVKPVLIYTEVATTFCWIRGDNFNFRTRLLDEH